MTECRTQSHYATLRSELRSYGVEALQESLITDGWFVRSDGGIEIHSGVKPFNPFARLVTGQLAAPYGNLLCQVGLSSADREFFVAKNRPELDEVWNSSDPTWIGKASMAQRHQFLLIRTIKWETFNVATFAIEGGADQLVAAIELLNRMESVAREYTRRAGWSNELGLFFHSYPFNSVQALHLHMVDLTVVGPTFHHLSHKNLSLDDVRQVLMRELAEVEPNATNQLATASTNQLAPMNTAHQRKGSNSPLSKLIDEDGHTEDEDESDDPDYREKGESDVSCN